MTQEDIDLMNERAFIKELKDADVINRLNKLDGKGPKEEKPVEEFVHEPEHLPGTTEGTEPPTAPPTGN
jgi:hypothetical protein